MLTETSRLDGAETGAPPATPLSRRDERRPRAVVIGAGFGGLAAGVRLAAKGYRVTLCDRLDAVGGRAYVHRRDGFVFDAGPTIVTAPFLFEELWALAGRSLADDVELIPLDPFYVIRFDDGRAFRYSGDPKAMRAEVEKFDPAAGDAYERFCAYSAEIYETAFVELAAKSFDDLWFTLKSGPKFLALDGHRSVYGKTADLFADRSLRTAFSFHPLLIGGNPLDATAYYCLIAELEKRHGVHYAMGGMGALARGLAGLLEGLGGEVRLSTEVARIDHRDGRATGVALASGERLEADVVVSNADPGWTYRHLAPGHRPKRWSHAKLDRARYSMGVFVWYFGVRRRYDHLPHHMILLGPRYEELLADIFDRKILAEDCSLYLHRPSATDPSVAPEGCDAFYVLSPTPNLAADVDWSIEGERYRKRIQKRLEETVLPGLGDALATSFFVTPADFEADLLSPHGAGFSLQPTLFQSAWFRPHNKSEELDNLFLVGAGTHPGAGVPGVLCSAKVIDALVEAR